MMMIDNEVRSQVHTILSREFIKPSSPTPSHLKTYNLTVFDQIIAHRFMPMVMFYPNTSIHPSSHDKTMDLKKSLSQTLTKYYPLAGRYDKVAPAYVDCNDSGAEFFEASVDGTLSDFLQNSQHKDLDHLFPHGLNDKFEDDESDKVIPLMVQVNHFECGGLAVAVSISHKVADGTSLARFIDDWAKMTRFCSKEQTHEVPIDPQFISFPYNDINFKGLMLYRSNDCVTRSFMFPNQKINDLKVKVKAMAVESGQPITNPTRIEVLYWLLYKCAVAAATKNNSGSFRPSTVNHIANIRGKMIEPLPEKSIGNFFMIMEFLTKNESDLEEMQKLQLNGIKKLQLNGIKNIESVFDYFSKFDLEEMQQNFGRGYTFSSLCGYPAYEIDFGWGKPVRATIPAFAFKNCLLVMDAPNKDGIEAIVCLEKRDMDIFQSDPELLAFT